MVGYTRSPCYRMEGKWFTHWVYSSFLITWIFYSLSLPPLFAGLLPILVTIYKYHDTASLPARKTRVFHLISTETRYRVLYHCITSKPALLEASFSSHKAIHFAIATVILYRTYRQLLVWIYGINLSPSSLYIILLKNIWLGVRWKDERRHISIIAPIS